MNSHFQLLSHTLSLGINFLNIQIIFCLSPFLPETRVFYFLHKVQAISTSFLHKILVLAVPLIIINLEVYRSIKYILAISIFIINPEFYLYAITF